MRVGTASVGAVDDSDRSFAVFQNGNIIPIKELDLVADAAVGNAVVLIVHCLDAHLRSVL